jgi:DNA polymerase III delta subunit
MFYLLHGENTSASRQALIDLKKKYSPDSVSVFDAKNLDFDELTRTLETPAMLAKKRLVIVEGKLPAPTMEQWNNEAISDLTDLVFWIGDELKASDKLFQLVKTAGGQVKNFKEQIPKNVFGFLDALGYKNKRKAFLELHRLLNEGQAPLYLLTMVLWQIRNLLSVKVSKYQSVKGMNPYVLRKVQSQAKNFEEEELVEIFKKLLYAETKIKTTSQDPVLILDRLVDQATS